MTTLQPEIGSGEIKTLESLIGSGINYETSGCGIMDSGKMIFGKCYFFIYPFYYSISFYVLVFIAILIGCLFVYRRFFGKNPFGNMDKILIALFFIAAFASYLLYYFFLDLF